MTEPVIRIRPASAGRWDDLVALFGDRGACGGCWCMAWRLPKGTWEANKGAKNRAALRRLTRSEVPPGILGYHGSEPVAWCAVAPRSAYPSLARSRVLKPIDDCPVWSVSCLFVRKDHRRQGAAVAMLRGAIDFVRRQGGRVIEGYPVIPWADKSADTFLWTGTVTAFERAGFVEAGRFSPSRPIMRFLVSNDSTRRRAAARDPSRRRRAT